MYRRETLERIANVIQDNEMWLIVIDYHEPSCPYVIFHKSSEAQLLVEKDYTIRGPHGKWIVYDEEGEVHSGHHTHWNAINAAKLRILQVVTQMV